ncbi:hypothetical protein ACTU3I_06270 [Microbacterium sp. RD1]|uniref:hypothetical protein n=1 Tax=Microbacterium sp. RD1 TaxID=3457313 RepID=UPI003FA58FC7
MTLTTSPSSAPARPARAGADDVAFTGSWPALTAWAVGLILAALGAGGVVGPGTIASRVAGILVFALALGFLAWGAVVLARARMLLPRLVLAAAAVGVLLTSALLALAPAHTSVFAVGTVFALLLVLSGFAAAAVRRRTASPRTPSVWGLILAAAVLSVVVTPALGATQDAVLIRSDGTVPVVVHGH